MRYGSFGLCRNRKKVWKLPLNFEKAVDFLFFLFFCITAQTSLVYYNK